jgi:beta-glucosidase/6-phospho-beta-glucosidase/beta-galactosidase
MQIKKQWNNKPIIITENGIADRSDRYRAPFIIAHLQQIKQQLIMVQTSLDIYTGRL